MSHEIYDSKSYVVGNPAWHGLGITMPEGTVTTAQEALDKVGDYRVALNPLHHSVNGVWEPSGYNQIIRVPNEKDPTWAAFGDPVSDHYELIQPMEFCGIWDKAVRSPSGEHMGIETFGVLFKGAELFISTKTLTTQIKQKSASEEIVYYLVAISPMNGQKPVIVMVTAIRPVCNNTLQAGLARSQTRINLPHYRGVAERTEKYLSAIYKNQTKLVAELTAEYTAMANTPIDMPTAQALTNELYPIPKAPEDFSEDKAKAFDSKVAKTKEIRTRIMNVFEGGHVTQQTPLLEGTAYGWVNATSLVIRNLPTRKDAVNYDILWGDRGATIGNAHELAMSYIKGKELVPA